MAVTALRYPDIDAAVANVSSHDSSWIVNAANPKGSHSMDSASSTAYTGLLALDNETLLLSYDRLANGWAGPPGRLGDSDYVFFHAGDGQAQRVRFRWRCTGLRRLAAHQPSASY